MRPIRIRRVYDPPRPDDGTRVLVDRLWPRGVRRAELRLDAWWKDLAPSDGLRRWFHSQPDLWEEFRRRYRDELADQVAQARELLAACGEGPLTLLTAHREPERSHALVLREFLVGLNEGEGSGR